MNTTEAIATEVIASMRKIAAEFAEGSPAALDKANAFFCRTFANADAAWAECEAFSDDFEATLER